MELRVCVLGFGVCGGGAGGCAGAGGGGGEGGVGAGAGGRGPGGLVAVVVDCPVPLGRGGRGLGIVDGLLARGVGGVAAEARLEGVAGAVGEEGGHAGGAEAGGGGVGEGVVAVVVFGVCVDALPLCFAPADAPGAVAAGGRDGDDAADVVGAEVGPFEDEHAAHGTADDGGDLLDAEVVEEELVEAGEVVSRGEGGGDWIVAKVGGTHLTSSRIVVSGNSGPYRSFAGLPSLFVTGLALP